jgi:DnaD/phage-associated family protein
VSVPAVAAKPAAKVKTSTPRPKVHKPQLPEVLRRRNEDGEFDGLIVEVGARMGRPLGNSDLETLLYLYENVGLPAAVILMVVGYAVQMERINIRYIEKVALDWADRGIVTMEAVEDHLCYLERCDQAAVRVQQVCELAKPLSTAAALRLAEKWIFEWKVTDEVLGEAYAVCREKTGKFEARYMDRVLENWHNQGVTSAEEVPTKRGKKANTAAAEPTEYEQMVEQYVPIYKKKG